MTCHIFENDGRFPKGSGRFPNRMFTGSKGRFETCLYVEGGVVGDWGLGGYYVDEAAWDVDQLSDGFALGVGLNSRAGEGHLSHFFF